MRQEDAHEYLRQLLDCMHEEILKAHNVKLSNEKLVETTLINRIFGGSMCNELKCGKCNYSSKTFNQFQDISLDVTERINSIGDAIQSFTRSEVLGDGNEWLCGGCKQKVKATKQMTINRPPLELVLHLKRFSFGRSFGKINKEVKFDEVLYLPCRTDGEESIDTTKVLPTGGQRKKDYDKSTSGGQWKKDYDKRTTLLGVRYRLHAVIVHHGNSVHSGHYVAYVKAANGQWHEMNDATVTLTSIQKVINQQCYILFYTQENVNNTSVTTTDQKVVVSAEVPSAKLQSNGVSQSITNESGPRESVKDTIKVPNSNRNCTENRFFQNEQNKLEDDDIGEELTELPLVKDRSHFSQQEVLNLSHSNVVEKNESQDNDLQMRLKPRVVWALKPFYFLGYMARFKRWKPVRREVYKFKISGPTRNEYLFCQSTTNNLTTSDGEQVSSEISNEYSDSGENYDIMKSVSFAKKQSKLIGEKLPVSTSSLSSINASLFMTQEAKRARVGGSEGIWEDVTPAVLNSIKKATVKLRSEEHGDLIKRKTSDWDKLLDKGRVKKMKLKVEDKDGIGACSEDFGVAVNSLNPFQEAYSFRNNRK